MFSWCKLKEVQRDAQELRGRIGESIQSGGGVGALKWLRWVAASECESR